MSTGPKRKGRAAAFDRQLGERLRQARQLREMSLDTLSSALGISYQQLQKYEKGNNRISVSRLRDISRVLRVPLTSLVGDEAPPPAMTMLSRRFVFALDETLAVIRTANDNLLGTTHTLKVLRDQLLEDRRDENDQ